MKINNAEIIKTNKTEMGNVKDMLQEARTNVSQIELEASQAEEDARSLELELIQAQAAHERREEAERQGKETNEKIAELTG
ncbi:MAG: hypothetical protein Q7T54_02590 [Candidatus Levybacteria bacterium]|nr:hypothetical protein [Candidatus Levybacteria bacterium]